jgi:hypothetical protein
MARFRVNVSHANFRVGEVIEIPIDSREAVLGIKSKRLSLLDEPVQVEHTEPVKPSKKKKAQPKKAEVVQEEEPEADEPGANDDEHDPFSGLFE